MECEAALLLHQPRLRMVFRWLICVLVGYLQASRCVLFSAKGGCFCTAPGVGLSGCLALAYSFFFC